MYLPQLQETERSRDMIQEFCGLNRNIRIGDNEFSNMKNLTSDYYPVLSPRRKRGMVKQLQECNGLHAKNKIAYIDGNTLCYDNKAVLSLDSAIIGERQLISMGAYLLVFPDMMYFNTANQDEKGNIYDAPQSFSGEMTFQLCDENGTEINFNDLIVDVGVGTGETVTPFWHKAHGANNLDNAIWIDPLFWYGDKIYLPGIPNPTLSIDIEGDEIEYSVRSSRFSFESYGKIAELGWDSGGVYLQSAWEYDEYGFCIAKDELDTLYDKYFEETDYITLGHIYITRKYQDQTIRRTYTVVAHKTRKIKLPSIKIGDLRMKLRDGVSTIERCMSIRDDSESDFANIHNTWDDDLCWQDIKTYLKITFDGIGKKIETILDAGTSDTIIASGTTYALSSVEKKYASDQYMLVKNVVKVVDSASILLEGCLNLVTEINETANISTRIPKKMLDYVIECNNRLWGCRYGKNQEGKLVNEIYATKDASYSVWDSAEGTAEDSYGVSLGSDGDFTGAINYNGTPIFFKENCCHAIYGTYPSNYQVVTDMSIGLQKGSHKSLCIISNILYYKAPDGVYRYDGATHQKISTSLGLEHYTDAVGGAVDGKYYICMTAENGSREIFVYDTVKDLWHKEDTSDVAFFARYKDDLWFYDKTTKNLCTVKGSEGEQESSEIEWFAETGVIGYSTPDSKYVGKLQLRLMLPVGSRLNFFIEYDSDGCMSFVGGLEGRSHRSFTLPILPRRCDHFKIRMEGKGDCKIFSLAKVMEQGGEL